MPYFIDRNDLTVVVLPPGRAATPDLDAIDTAVSEHLVDVLRHGQQLTPAGASCLIAGDVEGFSDVEGITGVDGIAAADRVHSPALPPLGRWEYKVVHLTEVGGFGTARGSATRMSQVLNQLAGDGWELVVSTERENRFLGGETVILTFRRFVTTEAMFTTRYLAEERLRRAALEHRTAEPVPEGA